MNYNNDKQKRITNLNSQLTRKNSRIKELNDKIKILEKSESKKKKIIEVNRKDNKDDINKIIKENSELKNNIQNLKKRKERIK